MYKRKDSRSGTDRLGASFKVAFIVAAVGFVALAFEHTRIAAPADAKAAASPVLSRASEGAAMSHSPLPATTSEYFPSRFAPPSGEIEAQPPTF